MAVKTLMGAASSLKRAPSGKGMEKIYDNPRENIDPHVRTGALTAKEIHVPGITTQTEEAYDGSDCSGTSGTENRTLTLANSSASSLLMVWLDGLLLKDGTHYSVVHNAAASVVTFLGLVWDDQYIIVRYNQ